MQTSPPSTTAGPSRASAVRRVLWATLALNLAVAIAKLIAGIATSTLSMIADGYHSLLDAAGNIVGLIALSVAHRPPDEDHQYGHRKFEVLASIGISVMLFVAAVEILVSCWQRLRGDAGTATYSTVSVTIMLLTMVANLGVSRYEARRGRELRSPLLVADSRHTASDLYASASVLIALVALRLGLGWIDPIAALIIGGVILLAGYKILRWCLGVLADRALINARAIEEIAMRFPHVRSCQQVRTRGFADAVFVDMTLRFEPSLTLREAHDICDRLEERVREAFPEVADIVVHAEPEEPPAAPILTPASQEK